MAGPIHSALTARAHQAQRPPAHDVEGEGGRRDRDDHREEDQLERVGDRHREMEGEHAHEVHAPDADAHRDGAARDPRGSLAAVGERDAAGEIEGGIGRQDRDQDREEDDRRGCTIPRASWTPPASAGSVEGLDCIGGGYWKLGRGRGEASGAHLLDDGRTRSVCSEVVYPTRVESVPPPGAGGKSSGSSASPG